MLLDIHQFPNILKDYILQKPSVRPFYNHHYVGDALEKLIAQKQQQFVPREDLVQTLQNQYHGIALESLQKENLHALSHTTTYTVTTGHQLSMLGGTWFVAYKILATIAYAQQLQKQNANYKIVPIFWMATEDHDIAEINHVHLKGKTYTYPTEYKGMAGKLPLSNISNWLEPILAQLPKGTYTPEVIQQLKKAYHPNHTLAEATRLWIQNLFGHLGILVLDAYDPQLKKHFYALAEREIQDKISYQHVTQTNQQLSALGYDTPVHPREMNVFYIHTNAQRERWNVNTHVLNPKHIESISPNVVLRPVYQELILPNLAYIGGPNELAYWFQLKSTFEAYQVPFPTLVPRYLGAQVPTAILHKMEKLGINISDILNVSSSEYIAQYFRKQLVDSSSIVEQKLEDFYETWLVFAKENAPHLQVNVDVEVLKMEQQWRHFIEKTRKHHQKQQQEFTQTIHHIYDTLLPQGAWQERKESFLTQYVLQGKNIWQEVLDKDITQPYFWLWDSGLV